MMDVINESILSFDCIIVILDSSKQEAYKESVIDFDFLVLGKHHTNIHTVSQ
jgi:hypothetical protein